MTAITSVEQLAALPVGTVLRDAWSSCVEMTPGRPLHRYILPATVLYRPDRPSQDALHAAVQAVEELHRQPAVIVSANELPVIYERTRRVVRAPDHTDAEETP